MYYYVECCLKNTYLLVASNVAWIAFLMFTDCNLLCFYCKITKNCIIKKIIC